MTTNTVFDFNTLNLLNDASLRSFIAISLEDGYTPFTAPKKYKETLKPAIKTIAYNKNADILKLSFYGKLDEAVVKTIAENLNPKLFKLNKDGYAIYNFADITTDDRMINHFINRDNVTQKVEVNGETPKSLEFIFTENGIILAAISAGKLFTTTLNKIDEWKSIGIEGYINDVTLRTIINDPTLVIGTKTGVTYKNLATGKIWKDEIIDTEVETFVDYVGKTTSPIGFVVNGKIFDLSLKTEIETLPDNYDGHHQIFLTKGGDYIAA